VPSPSSSSTPTSPSSLLLPPIAFRAPSPPVFTADEDDPDGADCLALLSPKVGSVVRQRLADRCRIYLGAATWRSMAVDLGPVGHVGGRCRPGQVPAAGDLSVAEGRMAAPGAAGGKPLEPFPSGQRPASTAWGDAMSLPLEGLLVADFSQVLAGPLAAAMLADLGAIVIKVERPRVGDDTRQWGPPWTYNSSSYFEAANRSKKSVELDLSDREDLQLAQELARRADVLLENYRDGTFARKGLGYDQVAGENPRIVYVSITGFGRQGGKDLPGYDFLVQAVGGLMSITGTPGEPMKAGVALVDVLTAKDAVIGILAALRARESVGTGQRVEVNLLSSLLGSLANQASAYLATGNAPVSMGNRHPSIAPYETLAAKDGHLAICCGNDEQFRKLTLVLGIPDTADDVRFASNGVRVTNRDDLVVVLESALAVDTVDAWTTRLASVGVPAGQVGSIADAFELAERLGLEPTVSVGSEAPPQTRNPITLSKTPLTRYAAPPRLGEHNHDVRRWLTEETDR
jgi:crotonobetainyl-CoA:carnitine CoA-transferase CaiB-like acyl-CoA transferase